MALTKNKKIIFIFLTLTIGFLLAFTFAEITIRIFAPQNLSGSWRQNIDSGLIVNKDSGTSQHQQGERRVQYNFTDFHTRNSKIKPGHKKILILGDSFTFGWMLDYENTYIAQLQKRLDETYPDQKYQLINAAAGGWGSASYCRYLEEFGNKIKPDQVLVILSTDDIGRAYKSGLYSFADKADSSLQVLNKPYSKTRGFLRSFPGYQLMLQNSHCFQLLRKFLLSGSAAGGDPHTAAHGPRSRELKLPVEESQKLAKAIFQRIKNWCSKNKSGLMVTTHGWGKNIVDELQKKKLGTCEPTVAFQLCAKSFFQEENIPFYDSTELINELRGKNSKDYVIPLDCHPNEKGAALIAQVIWKQFLQEQLRPKK
jgi:lysophospholipase L1-like esterase